MERLQKYMSKCGIASRRKSEELILSGKVIVNGQVVKELGTKVTNKDEIMVDGKIIGRIEKEYYLLYKPKNVISSTKDEKGRTTVVDLVESKSKVFPIGRLDYDTTGIILITNDGELSNLLTHPNSNIEKEYMARITGYFKKEDAIKLSKGIKLNGIMTKPAYFKLKKYDKRMNKSYIKVIITEGRNHQVKEMFKYCGYIVDKLKRERYAFLDLTNLNKGEYRNLSIKEVKKLYKETEI